MEKGMEETRGMEGDGGGGGDGEEDGGDGGGLGDGEGVEGEWEMNKGLGKGWGWSGDGGGWGIEGGRVEGVQGMEGGRDGRGGWRCGAEGSDVSLVEENGMDGFGGRGNWFPSILRCSWAMEQRWPARSSGLELQGRASLETPQGQMSASRLTNLPWG